MFPDLRLELAKLKSEGRLRDFIPVEAREGAYIFIRGKKLLDFSNWDLFHYNFNKSVLRAAHQELETGGLGANAPRLSSGSSPQHIAFEQRLAKFLNLDRALLFTSKNQAALSLVTALLNERSVAIIDELVQSPVADAAYLVNACITSFDSEKLESLELELQRSPDTFKKYIFIEGLSPLKGKANDIARMIEIAAQYNAVLVIDESFSLGLLGLRGAGSLEELSIRNSPVCVYSSISFGSSGLGAFVAGDSELISFLINQSRTFMTEAALPAAYLAGMETALNILELDVASREKLKDLGLRLKNGLREMDFKVSDFPCPLVCIPFETRRLASEFAEGLVENGFLGEVLLKGSFLDAGAILRFLINIKHTEANIDSLLQAINDLRHLLRKGKNT